MNEIWKDIAGYEGMYQVSNTGRVRSVYRRVKVSNGTRVAEGVMLRTEQISGGYVRVMLVNAMGVRKRHMVHRLVANAFIPNPQNKPEVNHKNSITNSNSADNLEWVTRSENHKYAFKYGNRIKMTGRNHPQSKAVCLKNDDGLIICKFESISDASRATGQTIRFISKICKNEIKREYGLNFYFI